MFKANCLLVISIINKNDMINNVTNNNVTNNNVINTIKSDNMTYTVNEIIGDQINKSNKIINYYLSKEVAYYNNLLPYIKNYTGLYKSWYRNGTLRVEMSYVNGIAKGNMNFYSEDGILLDTQVY